MDNYIQIFPNSLSLDTCKNIIECHTMEKNKFPGNTFNGVDKNIKDTTDYHILQGINGNNMWNSIEKILEKALYEKIQIYVDNMNKNIFGSTKGNNCGYSIFKTYEILTDDGFLVQKYDKGIGKYTYHNDSKIYYEKHRSRLLTYMWYINTVEEGGETEFLGGKLKIKPEAGTLVIFPANWLYPHRACVPISDNKYIVTGWLYEEDKNYLKK